MVFVQAQINIFKKKVDRYPRLDTVLMIEDAIRKGRGDLTVRQVWESLPKKTMWRTFLTALDYLEYSGKIILEEDRTITWVWAPQKIRNLRKNGLVIE